MGWFHGPNIEGAVCTRPAGTVSRAHPSETVCRILLLFPSLSTTGVSYMVLQVTLVLQVPSALRTLNRSDANWVLANGGVCIRSYLHHFYNLFFINLRAQKNREEQMHFVLGWRSCNNAIRVYGYDPVAVPPLWLRESSRKVGTAKYDFIFINMISFL